MVDAEQTRPFCCWPGLSLSSPGDTRLAVWLGGIVGGMVHAWSSHAATGSTGQPHQASTGQSKHAWSQAGLTFTEQRSDTGNTCVADAYGQVRLFLTHTRA